MLKGENVRPTTARRFGSLGRSFVAPAAAAAVMGAALIASDTTDTAQTVWSPAAACLLPDVLPVAGTLLSYGGNRQLAAGGTVTHDGAFSIGVNALTCGGISASGPVVSSAFGSTTAGVTTTLCGTLLLQPWNGNNILLNPAVSGGAVDFGRSSAVGSWSRISFNTPVQLGSTGSVGISSSNPWDAPDIRYARGSGATADVLSNAGARIRNLANSADAALTCGAVTASGDVTFVGAAGGFRLNNSGISRGVIYHSGFENRLNSTGALPWVVESDSGFRVRNAANTADAALTCGAITASGSMTTFDGFRLSGATVNRSITFGGTIQDYSHSDNAATSRRFRWLANNATELANLWTDSGQSKLFEVICPSASRIGRITRAASGQTANLDEWHNSIGNVIAFVSSGGAFQETPTQSALNPTNINIPSGRRQGWYNTALTEFRDWVNIGGTLLKSAAYS